MRWANDSKDIGNDSDTCHTTFELLTKLCENKHLNALDVLGLSMTAANETVKYEELLMKAVDPTLLIMMILNQNFDALKLEARLRQLVLHTRK